VVECFFWYRPTRVVPDRRPLNGCVFVCVCIIIFMLRFCFPGYSMAQKNHAVNHREPKTVEISLMLADLKKIFRCLTPGVNLRYMKQGCSFSDRLVNCSDVM